MTYHHLNNHLTQKGEVFKKCTGQLLFTKRFHVTHSFIISQFDIKRAGF